MTKLKPCPFCGGDAYLNQRYNSRGRVNMIFAQCDFCGSRGRIFSSYTDAAEDNWQNDACVKATNAWNKRVEVE